MARDSEIRQVGDADVRHSSGRRRRNVLWLAVLLSALAALIPVSLDAAASPSKKARRNPPSVAKAKAPVSAPSMRAFIDPETGKLREPTPEEVRALWESAKKTAVPAPEDFEPIRHAGGMVSVDLKGALMSHVIVHRNPDGSLSSRCVPAPRVGATLVPAAPPLEEK